MQIKRHFTVRGQSPYKDINFVDYDSEIRNPDGSVVFSQKGIKVPDFWPLVSRDILAQKYFRRAGVPHSTVPVTEDNVPLWICNSIPAADAKFGRETDARKVFHRLAGCWTYHGWKEGYFSSEEDASAFYDELCYMLVHQMAAPNSPTWFNVGLNWAYGITSEPQGNWRVNPKTGIAEETPNAYQYPTASACHILSLADDMTGPGGIMDLWVREAKVFKFGSGVGVDCSALRGKGEPLSAGGVASGPMSFLPIGDRSAGSIKSGGTTRRSALMRILHLDHPDIESFITWKAKEEYKVAALITGSRHLSKQLNSVLISAYETPPSTKAEKAARAALIPENYIQRVKALARQGIREIHFPVFNNEFEGEAYITVSGQNSNNSVRVPNSFMQASPGGDWALYWRTELRKAEKENRKPNSCKTLKVGYLWDEICTAAWQCADPGLQYEDTINEWHTCPNDGRIKASNPCVTGDTLITTDKGLKRIDEMLDGNYSVMGSDGKFHPVGAAFKTGVKRVYCLRTSAGYELKLTADHLVKTKNRGDVAANELTEKDLVVLSVPQLGTEILDSRLTEFLGLMLGDGCLVNGKTATLTLSPEYEALATRVVEKVQSFKKEFAADWRGRRKSGVNQPQATLRINVGTPAVIDELKRFAVLDKGSKAKCFTNEIYSLSKESLVPILQGLFTTDGTVANYGDKSQYISLDSTSIALLQQVQLLLLAFDIKSKLYRNRNRGRTTSILPDGKGGMREYPVEPAHSLRISRISRIRFEYEIGFLPDSYKAEQLTELNKQVSAYLDPLNDKIVSFEYVGEESVYDLTEPITQHFVANGIVVHNCSEYLYLDNTSCNLASTNLLSFYDAEHKTFDLEAYRYTCRLWTIVLDITVGMAQYPSKETAEGSFNYRTLGLGYGNLGALLMQQGIPYDSNEGRVQAAALTAIMHFTAYLTSADLAAELGAFPRYEANAKEMQRVISNHRLAIGNYCEKMKGKTVNKVYDGLTVIPTIFELPYQPISKFSSLLLLEAREIAIKINYVQGFRNAQASLIAPVGTIGLLMGMDTTGCEPDFALVKFKKLAGGGYVKLINDSVIPGLRALGYTESQIKDINNYCVGTGSIKNCMELLVALQKEGSTTSLSLDDLENKVATTMDVRWLFETSGIKLDLTPEQWARINNEILGTMTIEGAPHLKPEHYSVFDCANKCGRLGTRSLSVEAHIKMCAAIQPFLSGSISKTVNLPNSATIDDIKNAYRLSWELGLKSCALYRDGSKLSQPLNTMADEEEPEEEQILPEDIGSLKADPARMGEILARKIVRKCLPDKRYGYTQKVRIGGHKVFLRTGEYEDGKLGEIWLSLHKEGAAFRALADCLAISVSLSLQHGVPLEEYIDAFVGMKFEPNGPVLGKNSVKMCSSIVDWIFRNLAVNYLGRNDLAHTTDEDHRDATTFNGSPETSPNVIPVLPTPEGTKKAMASVARDCGYTGDICIDCGGVRMVRSGNCARCLDCGATSGCS